MTATPALLAVLVGLVTSVGSLGSAGTAPAADPVGLWPLHPEPAVVRGFDPPESPYGAGHRGVDLLGHPGQTVRTALPGTVTYAGRLAGRGVVVVSHGATRTTYEPVLAAVPVGRPVARGDPIGTLELPGSHCFPRACLHWGWIAGETYLDPLRLVGAGPVRLLPLWREEPVSGSSQVPGPPATGCCTAQRSPGRAARDLSSYVGFHLAVPLSGLMSGLMSGLLTGPP